MAADQRLSTTSRLRGVRAVTENGTKGDPWVSHIRKVDTRIVLLDLGNCTRMHNGTGALFLPDQLHLEWRNGTLTECSLSGVRFREDGAGPSKWRTRCVMLDKQKPPPYHLTDETPQWVRALVYRHEPKMR